MEQKRIGILTFHRAHNYGAVLQCFALQEFLRSLGHDAYVIDYNNHDLWEGYDWFKSYEVGYCFQKLSKIPTRIIKLFIRWFKSIPRYYKFKRFQEKQLCIVPKKDIQNTQNMSDIRQICQDFIAEIAAQRETYSKQISDLISIVDKHLSQR